MWYSSCRLLPLAAILPGNDDTNRISVALFKPGGCEHRAYAIAEGRYARDADGEGVHKVHVNTIDGTWSLLRSWLSTTPRHLTRGPVALSGVLRIRA